MFKRSYAVATVLMLMLVLAGAGMMGCPPQNNNGNGTKVQFTITAESLVPDAHFGKLFAVTHDNSMRVFRENQAVGAEFQEFNFMNDSGPLLALLTNASGVTDLHATEEDLSGLGTTNTTLTFTMMGMTDDLFTIFTPQFQTLSTFAAVNAGGLPTNSQVFNLGMFSTDQNNVVTAQSGGTTFVRVTVTRN